MNSTPIMGVAVIEDTAVKGFDVLLDKGVLGAFVVFLLLGLIFAGLVIRFLYNEGRSREKELVVLLERMLTLMEGAKTTSAQNAENLAKQALALASVERALSELSHDVSSSVQASVHGFNNVGTSFNSVVEVLKDLRDSMKDLLRRGGA
jgi:hypothetical protein